MTEDSEKTKKQLFMFSEVQPEKKGESVETRQTAGEMQKTPEKPEEESENSKRFGALYSTAVIMFFIVLPFFSLGIIDLEALADPEEGIVSYIWIAILIGIGFLVYRFFRKSYA